MKDLINSFEFWTLLLYKGFLFIFCIDWCVYSVIIYNVIQMGESKLLSNR